MITYKGYKNFRCRHVKSVKVIVDINKIVN